MLERYLVSHALAVATSIASLVVGVHLLGIRRTPQSLLAWLLAIVFVPFVAIPLYFLIGARKFPRRAKQPARQQAPRPPSSAGEDAHPVQRVMATIGAAPARAGNAFGVLENGEAAYRALLDLIAGAKTSIHVTVFILGDDATGRAVIDALAKRAREGLDVRVVVDAVGSAIVFGHARRVLTAAGGDVRRFMPLIHAPVRGRTNLRCHRKVVIADGADVFLGGMNFALEYMGEAPLATRWRDIAVLASGPVAADAEALFASDWAYCGGGGPPVRTDADAVPRRGPAALQFIPSGPDAKEDTFYDAALTAMHCARRRIALVTPYYVPDDVMQAALLLAARRGVQTTLVVPAKSNHAIADFARRGVLRDLVAAGAEIRAYGRGMVHAKAMVVDDSFGYVGSANLDMRSLFLNYEDALFVYDAAEVAKIEGWIDALARDCSTHATDARSFGRRPHWILEQIARLLAPEL